MDYLFPNFLIDNGDFEKSKDYWRALCEDILTVNNQLQDWQPWFESESGDRQLYENFPVCTLINRKKTKGVIVNQQDPKYHTKWEVSAWIKESETGADENWASEYLVFNCNLTEENAKVFKRLFEQWVRPESNAEELKKIISEARLDGG